MERTTISNSDDYRAPLMLATERPNVVLRELATPEDDLAYFQAVEASRADLDEATATKYQTLDDVTRLRVEQAGQKLRMGIWDGAAFVGTVNAMADAVGGAEIGYWTDSRHTGHGYASLGAKALSAYIARCYSPVYAEVEEGNVASMAVLARAGFRHVGSRGDYIVFELSQAL